MQGLRQSVLVALALSLPNVADTQEVAPFFEQVPAVLVDTYEGVNAPVFNAYFEMLVDRYQNSGGVGWTILTESPTKAFRVTVLPEGLESMIEILAARGTSFQGFDEDQVALWNSSWGSRQVAVWNAAPALSVVPGGFTREDLGGLPFTRSMLYELEWDQAPVFQEALRERSALDREAGLGNNFVLTVWNGGIGTKAQTVLLRISAESRAADSGPNAEARRAARQDYRQEWGRLSRIMSASAKSVGIHMGVFRPELSFSPGR